MAEGLRLAMATSDENLITCPRCGTFLKLPGEKRRLRERYACVKYELTCTDMYECTDTDEMCENSLSYQDVFSDDDSDDGDDASDKEDGHSDIDWDTYFD